MNKTKEEWLEWIREECKKPWTAFEYLFEFKIYGRLPHSLDTPKLAIPSNSEIRRWLEKRSVLINDKFPLPNDLIQFPVNQLVFFPKGATKRCTYLGGINFTCWYKWFEDTFEDKEKTKVKEPAHWEFNHLENGHVEAEKPTVKFKTQAGWNNSKWKRHYALMDITNKITKL